MPASKSAFRINDCNPIYFDDTRPDPLRAPPLLSVSLEWPLVLQLRSQIEGASAAELQRGVHATHDVTFHRLARAGETLTTSGRVVAVERRPSGTLVLSRLDTTGEDGGPVYTTFNGGVYRDVDLERFDTAFDRPAPLPACSGDGGWCTELAVPFEAAHVYTERAAIWNPIHTERSVAPAAGLPDISLHGTATLGYAAQAIVDRDCGSDPSRLRRIACRFGAMVRLGSPQRLTVGAPLPFGNLRALGYALTTPEGGPAIRRGVAVTD